MRATLVHNPTAGHRGVTAESLLAALRAAGFHPRYQSTKDSGCERALQDPGDIVFVAGGDGTVFKVAAALGGRRVPMVLVPTGTANNIAAELGLSGPPFHVLEVGLRGEPRVIDLGWADTPAGRRHFVEGLGLGFFSEVLESGEPDPLPPEPDSPDDALRRDVRMWLRTLSLVKPNWYEVTLDGSDLSGHYIMVEVLNFPLLGPRLQLGGNADPSDGRLDLLLAGENDRPALEAYLRNRLEGSPGEPPLRSRRGTEVHASWTRGRLRTDGKLWERNEDACPEFFLARLHQGAITIMAPS